MGFGAPPLFPRSNSQSRSHTGVAYLGPFRAKHMRGNSKGNSKGSKKKKTKQRFFLDKVFPANETEFKIDKTRLLLKKNALGTRAYRRAVGARAHVGAPCRSVLLRPRSCGAALQKRAPPSCCALAGTVALCKSARRRAIVPWLLLRSAKTHGGVVQGPGWPLWRLFALAARRMV